MGIIIFSLRQNKGFFTHPKRIVFLVIMLAVLAGYALIELQPVSALTGIRRTINFQGKLVNANGTNVTDGNYSIAFAIYDVASGGTALWSETQGTVAVADGVFQVELGSSTAFPADFNFNWDGRYLGVNVASDGEMTPRIRLTAVPYAFNAEKVAGLTVQDDTGAASTSAILQIANAKTVVLKNSLTFQGTDSTVFTFPNATGTVVTLDAIQSLTNKTIGSTGLTFSGAATDITTVTDEHLTLAGAGTGDIIFDLDGDSSFIIDSFITDANAVLYTDTSGAVTRVVETETGSLCLLSGVGASGVPAWGSCPGGGSGSSNWVLNSTDGTLSPINNTLDLLVGGTASTSAKFSVLGIAGDNPSASVSATTGANATKGIYLSGDGSLQSVRNNTLTIGGNTTGDISVLPGNGSGLFNLTGSLAFGAAKDTNLYRSAADTLKTDDNFQISLTGSTTSNPRIAAFVDNSVGNAARFQLGDDSNAFQNGWDQDLQIYGYHGIVLQGRRETSGAPSFIPKTTYEDYGVIIPNTQAARKAFTIIGASTQADDLVHIFSDSGHANPFFTLDAGEKINLGPGGATAPDVTLYRADANVLGTDDSFRIAAGGTFDTLSAGTLGIGTTNATTITLGRSGQGITMPAFDCSGNANGGKLTTTSGGVLTCGDDASGGGSGSSNWVLNASQGTLSPVNNTLDFLIGGTATSSAIFSVLNVDSNASGDPTIRLGPDNSNNMLISVGSTGISTFNAVGSGSLFRFQDSVSLGIDESQNGLLTFFSSGAGETDPTIQANSTGDLLISAPTGVVTVGSGTGDVKVDPGADNFLVDLTSTGDFLVEDGGIAFATFSDTGGINFAPNGTSDLVMTGDADSNLQLAFSAAPGVDMTVLTNTGFGTTTTDVDGLTINFTNGDTDAQTNAGLHIETTSSNTNASSFLYGIDVDDLTSGGESASEVGIRIGTGWDQGLVIESGGSTNSGLVYSGAGRPTKTITLSPEYAGGVLTASNSASITGSMTSDASSSAGLNRTYYEWSSTQTTLQDYTVAVRMKLPADFSDWASGNTMTVSLNTADTSSGVNGLDVYIYNSSDDSTGRPVYFSTNNVSGTDGVWTTVNLTSTNLDDNSSPDWDAAGESVTIYLKMKASGTVNKVMLGDIVLSYLAKF